jgi:hypothetical protein
MSVTLDGTGVLLVGGKKVFPICLSNPPPLGKKAPSGKQGLAEVAEAGVSLIRTGLETWSLDEFDAQIAQQRALLDAAAAAGLRCWLWLGNAASHPSDSAAPVVGLMRDIVNDFKAHPGLGLWKGADEPANPLRGEFVIPPAPLVRAYNKLKTLDPDRPLVIIHAPRGSAADLTAYRPAFDITGADIYPISYPPGIHADTANPDITVVGDMTRKMRKVAGAKPVWMTLQIAWSGMARSTDHPDVVPRFPSLRQERFMAYEAIIEGARGLTFFGGHMTEVCVPADAKAGWNWTFWRQVLRPLVQELSSPELHPALIVADDPARVRPKQPRSDIELVVRRNPDSGYLYVIVAKRGGDTTKITLVGLPKKDDGTPIRRGEVLFEHVQHPPPLPRLSGSQIPRPVTVTNGGFTDWFAPYDVHVYRFAA